MNRDVAFQWLVCCLVSFPYIYIWYTAPSPVVLFWCTFQNIYIIVLHINWILIQKQKKIKNDLEKLDKIVEVIMLNAINLSLKWPSLHISSKPERSKTNESIKKKINLILLASSWVRVAVRPGTPLGSWLGVRRPLKTRGGRAAWRHHPDQTACASHAACSPLLLSLEAYTVLAPPVEQRREWIHSTAFIISPLPFHLLSQPGEGGMVEMKAGHERCWV
jgi:hypothetical protein